MKRRSIHSANCSCTGCVYRSRSKQPSVQQLIEQGSRIDKLYYGKYLPLRERKLLEKLIRTRAVYDDVRNQLLSSSGSSDHARSEHKIKRRDDDSTEKSSAVIKMVDLVDRGQIGSANNSKLSSCCSCCSCSSLRKIKKHMEKHPPRVHRHHVPYEDIARYTVEAEKRGRKRRRRLSTKISSKIRTVHFKMKKIQSEPCTCTLSLSSFMKRPSKAFMQKIRSRENATANAQAQNVTVERKQLKEKICSCSCKIAKLPMKSIQKIKTMRKSTTKGIGTDIGNQKAFKIRKDSLTLFREKLLHKRAYKDWECEPGTCVVDECIPEQCLKKIKAKGVGERRRVKYHNRISGTSIHSRISMSTRAKQIKRIDSKVQAAPGSTKGPVICECKPTTKSTSSMTSFPTPSMTTAKMETRKRRPATPKQRPQYIVKETTKQEKVTKTGRNDKKKLHISPGLNLGHVLCECKPYTKSISSMTSIPKTKRPKPRPQLLMKETVVQEKYYTANRDAVKQAEFYSVEREQALPVSKLGSYSCECPPINKSVSSMTSVLKTQASQSVSKTDIKVKRPITPKQRIQKETTQHEKAYKTVHQKGVVYVSPNAKVGYNTCECYPSMKSISLTSVRKEKVAKARKPKPGLQFVIEEEEKVYKSGGRKSKQIKQIKSHEIEIVQALPKSQLGHVICECKPKTKSTSSMTTTISRSKTKMKAKIPKSRRDTFKHRREPYEYHETEQEQSEKQAVKISSSFKFEIEFSKKRYPALSNKEIVEHVKKKRAKRIKPTHSRKTQYKKYQNSKIQVTGAKSKSSQESQISYLRESASQTSKLHNNIVLPFPRECEPSMCIPYECDPKSCARILLSRSKSRGRSVMASTERLRRKSAGSSTLSLKSNSKSRYVQSKSTESFVSHPRKIIKEPARQNSAKGTNLENSHQNKQAVRISSSFNFNIEFYKETPGLKTNEVKQVAYEPQREIKPTLHRKKYKQRGHRARNINSRHFSSQSRSSQSFKNIQVGHKLKRCFCTLKLLQKKKQISDREKRAHIGGKSTQLSRIAYVTPPVTSHPKSGPLYPCECSGNAIDSKKEQKSKRFREIESNTVYNKPHKKEKRQIHGKGIKVHKPSERQAASLTTKNVMAKQTNTKPFLKRCFCTLKLLKRNKEKAGNVTPYSRRTDYIVHMQNKSITNNRTNTKNQICECEPIPVECDPYKCEKIAKRHEKLRHRHSYTGDHATRSTFSSTSRTMSSSKTQYSQSYIRGSGDKAMKSTDKMIIPPSHTNRQVVRVGSNFSFNIEFSKENPLKNTGNMKAPDILPRKQPHDKYIHKYNHKVKLKTTGSQQLKHRSHHKLISAEAKHKQKGVFVSSAIKRCFCTLKFHKTAKNAKLREIKHVTSKSTKTSYPLQNPQTCECKSTSTKVGKPVHGLKSCECPPGMCNPYECYEELKKRGIKLLHNQQINTNRHRRKSTVSMTTTEFSVSSKTKSTQSRLLRPTKSKKDYRFKGLQEDMRYTRSIPPSRQAVQLGSNFSFNVEFFKERSFTSAQKLTHKIRTEDFDASSRVIKKDKGTKDKRLLMKNHPSQVIISKEDKAANVGFILKRCFCTLGMQKKKKPQHELRNYPPITVQIVQMDRNPKNTSKSIFPLHIKRTEDLNIANGHKMIKPRYSIANNAIYEKESLNFSKADSFYPFKKTIFDMNQNMYHLPQYLRSRIDFNVGEYQVGNLVIGAQEAKPFFQSFYALNVKVSKIKNIPGDTHALDDHECVPGVCVPYECDSAQCLKVINERIKLTTKPGSERRKNKNVGTTNKLKSKSLTTEPHSNNNKQQLNHKDHSSRLRGQQNSKVGSGINIGVGHKKDKNQGNGLQNQRHTNERMTHESQNKGKTLLAKCICPIKKMTETNSNSYKPASRQQEYPNRKQLRQGTDLSLTMGFYKDISSGGDNAMVSISTSPRLEAEKNYPTYSQKNQEHRNKTKGLIAKCLCPIKKFTETHLTPYLNRSSQGSSLPARRALRVGSDFSFGLDFYKDRNPHRNGFMVSTSPKSQQDKDVATHDENYKCRNYPQMKDEQQMKVVASKKSFLAKCLCPLKKISEIQFFRQKPKTNQKPNFAMGPCNFYKDTKHHNHHVMVKNAATRSSLRRLGHGDSQINDKSKTTTSGISQFITRCFCTAKLNTKTKQPTKTEKIGKSKKVIEPERITNKKTANVRSDKGMIHHLKHKSTSSLTKKSKSTKTKTTESNPTNFSTYSKYSSSQNRTDYGKNNRASEKQAVSFGSNISFSMAFIKDSNSALSSIYKQSKPVTQINQGARVSPVYFSKIEKTGYNRSRNEDPEPYVTRGKKYKVSNKEIKSILKSYDCTPDTCMHNKCVSIECDKKSKKRQLRPKPKNVASKKKTTSTKSAVIHRGTATKEKRLSKSFDHCHPENCETYMHMKAHSDVGKRNKKKGNKKPQDQEKSCCCALPSKQSTIKRKMSVTKQTDLNKFIQKCFCSIKRIKGGKELTPKPSIESITEGKNKKSRCDKKCKAMQDSDMKTIMPYSKKKFKKHDSQIKVTEMGTNTMYSFCCPCVQEKLKQNAKSKTAKKSKFTEKNKGQVLQNEDKLTICSICQNPLNAKPGKEQSVKSISKKKKDGKNAARLCTCSNGPIGDQIAVCSECQGNAGIKISKKRDTNNGVYLNLVPEKVGDQLDVTKKKVGMRPPLTNEQLAMSNLCPVCISKMNELQTMVQDKKTAKLQDKKIAQLQDKKKADPNKTVLQSNVCPCCQVSCNAGKKVAKLDLHKMKTSTNAEDPLFEMHVNQDMNILNRKEVLANLTSSDEESEKMKARGRRKGTSPVMEMVIDKHSANIVNCREILKTLIERETENESLDKEEEDKEPETAVKKKTVGKQKAKSIGSVETHNTKAPTRKNTVGKQKAKSTGAVETQNAKTAAKRKSVSKQKGKSTGAAEKKGKEKKAPPKQTKSNRQTPSQLHGSGCKCCACRKIKRPKSKGRPQEEMEEEEEENKTPPKPIFRKLRPCVCGSVACKKDWEKLYSEERSLKSVKKQKTCVCGSTICKVESSKIPELLLQAARREQNAKLKAIKAIKAEKRYQKERLQRKKLYAKEDKKRYKQRKKQDRIDMKKLTKYEAAPDCLMVAESLVDFGRFGAKAFCDLMTTTCRYIRHPRDAIHNIRDYSNEPGRAAKHVKQTCEGMGFFSTLARIRRRAVNMKLTKKAIVKLESYPITNYIVHMADKDPRKRMKKFKQKRTREPMDFECSLFMGSLRKRPCLVVYYTCPWFYPHCVSLLGLWKQFTDILLFILAVGVWSPCILCMELCRAMMCCCLCTG